MNSLSAPIFNAETQSRSGVARNFNAETQGAQRFAEGKVNGCRLQVAGCRSSIPTGLRHISPGLPAISKYAATQSLRLAGPQTPLHTAARCRKWRATLGQTPPMYVLTLKGLRHSGVSGKYLPECLRGISNSPA